MTGLGTLVLGMAIAQTPKGAPRQPALRGPVPAHAMAPHAMPLPNALAQYDNPLSAGRHRAPKGHAIVVGPAGELRGAPPANDNCANATLIASATSCTTTTGNVAGATQSIAALVCNTFEGDADDDVWYRFVATNTSHTIQVVGSAQFDPVVDLRSGACNGTNIACADASVAGQLEQIIANGLTVGNTYYVRVYDFNTGEPATTTFTICVINGAPPPPANDNCANAQTLTVHPDGECDLNATAGDNSSATQSIDGPSCDDVTTGIFADVWYTFNSGANADI
ncbi:MAG TPA: hypothetical protein VHL57_13040, partial [Flavobacteriales bacterium]|nr:hypothetical protein [Flavobacteriales bacterium]